MLRTLRLIMARHGLLGPSVHEWHSDPFDMKMRRLLPSGEWQYRDMTDAERDDEMKARAW